MFSKKKLIVLVEDNEQDEHLTIRALKKNNILNEIVVLRDGQEAVDYFSKASDLDIQVILLDIKLPKIDGLEVLSIIRSNDSIKNIPVVLLTTSNEESDVLRGYNLGANSYVRKPVDFEEFATAVKQLGLYWLVLNLPPKSV